MATAGKPVVRALFLASMIPLGTLAVGVVALLAWPGVLDPTAEFLTLTGAGILASVLGLQILMRAVRPSRNEPWISIVYVIASAVAVGGAFILVLVVRVLRLTRAVQ